ncbi:MULTISPECIES: PIG-L deacetylase family protein [Pseudonocardia]|uniref:PIG-L deacetylase family protein n=1 Tax=Pseudonocardia alni subsp. carboxydivorans TaxID=415010 RepID=A0ABU9A9X3_PSEA5|nr:PIG-L family deacetylase [Pseudonocardia alni]
MADLQPLPETFDRALVVVAHPDDMEYGGSGAVARWTAQGREVSYLLVTRGEAGIDGLDPAECGPVREAEQRAACAAVGVTSCAFLDHPDGLVEYSVALRRDIAAAIRRHRPQLVVTGNLREFWDAGESLNHADHVAVGRATVDAVRDAANRWLFPGTGPAWDGVTGIAAAASPASRHAVDISDHLDAAVASLSAHRTYLDGLGGGPATDPAGFLRETAEVTAARLPGATAATPFEYLRP